MTTTPDLLKRFADRMERIKTEIKGLQDDLKDLKAEMKSSGINEKAVDKLVAIRMKPKGKADAQIELFQDMLTYAPHVGVHMDLEAPESEPTPLEEAIGARKAKEAEDFDPDTGEVFEEEGARARGVPLTDTATRLIVEKFGRGAETLYATGAEGRA